VLCVDEKSQIQALNRTQKVLPMEPVKSFVGYSQLTVVPCLVNGFTPRVGRRW
jgi:hypothetical protein